MEQAYHFIYWAMLKTKDEGFRPSSWMMHSMDIYSSMTAASTDWMGGRKSAINSQLSPESRL